MKPFFAIKHLPSGGFLPARGTGKRGDTRGYTHDEPSTEKPPRLFTSERSAKLALGQWLAGPLVVRLVSTWAGIDGYDEREDWTRRPHSRDAKDMRVVEIEVREKNP